MAQHGEPAYLNEAAFMQQITIQLPTGLSDVEKNVRVRAFWEATRTITACSQIDATAARFNGEVYVSPEPFLLRSLPPELWHAFLGRPAGTVSQVYGKDDTYRVLIRC